jgi:hypothetical protein
MASEESVEEWLQRQLGAHEMAHGITHLCEQYGVPTIDAAEVFDQMRVVLSAIVTLYDRVEDYAQVHMTAHGFADELTAMVQRQLIEFLHIRP